MSFSVPAINKKQPMKTKAFSLIELLVSVSIFTIVITMAVGSLLVLIDANAKAQNMQDVMTNLSFVVDSMAREIRTGEGFYCSDTEPSATLDPQTSQDCASGGVYLSVVEGDVSNSLTGEGEPRVTYWYNSAQEQVERRVGDAGFYPLTDADVHISEAVFYVSDTDRGVDGDTAQPTVTIFISGYAGQIPSVDTSFDLQTTITKRVLDI